MSVHRSARLPPPAQDDAAVPKSPHAALLLAAAVSLASSGCGLFRAPLTCPERGGAAWTEWRSAHFILSTDVSAESARDTLVRFEALHDTLAHVMKRRPQASSSRVEVVLFDRAADYREIAGELHAGAFFTPQAPGDLEPRPVIVMPHDDLTAERDSTLLHELTHRFLRERYTTLPPWLNEGLSQYYASLRIDAGRIYLGAPGQLDFSDRPFFWYAWSGDAQQLQVPVYKAPTVQHLVDADHPAFHGGASSGETESDARSRRLAHYTAAWRLVHFLANGSTPDRRARFIDYLTELERGARSRDAFFAAFGGELPLLEQEVRHYYTQAPLRQMTVAAPPPTPALAPSERALGDADVHVLWARLLPYAKDGLSRAHHELDEVLTRNPDSPEVHHRRAALWAWEGRFTDARSAIEKAVGARPEEPRYLFARLQIGLLGIREQRDRLRDMLLAADHIDRLARTATTPMQQQLAGRLLGLLGRGEEGLRLSDRAAAADPLCWPCQESRAVLLLGARRYDEALAAVDRAIALLPEQLPSSGFVKLRVTIEAARSRAAGAAR